MFGGGSDHNEITIKCWIKDEHSWIHVKVRQKSKDHGYQDSSDEEHW